jgi:hypothetical protein
VGTVLIGRTRSAETEIFDRAAEPDETRPTTTNREDTPTGQEDFAKDRNWFRSMPLPVGGVARGV